jgi:hypothetical protein
VSQWCYSGGSGAQRWRVAAVAFASNDYGDMVLKSKIHGVKEKRI